MTSSKCTCHHEIEDHAAGPCAGRDGYGLPCECPSFEPCPCGATDDVTGEED